MIKLDKNNEMDYIEIYNLESKTQLIKEYNQCICDINYIEVFYLEKKEYGRHSLKFTKKHFEDYLMLRIAEDLSLVTNKETEALTSVRTQYSAYDIKLERIKIFLRGGTI